MFFSSAETTNEHASVHGVICIMQPIHIYTPWVAVCLEVGWIRRHLPSSGWLHWTVRLPDCFDLLRRPWSSVNFSYAA